MDVKSFIEEHANEAALDYSEFTEKMSMDSQMGYTSPINVAVRGLLKLREIAWTGISSVF